MIPGETWRLQFRLKAHVKGACVRVKVCTSLDGRYRTSFANKIGGSCFCTSEGCSGPSVVSTFLRKSRCTSLHDFMKGEVSAWLCISDRGFLKSTRTCSRWRTTKQWNSLCNVGYSLHLHGHESEFLCWLVLLSHVFCAVMVLNWHDILTRGRVDVSVLSRLILLHTQYPLPVTQVPVLMCWYTLIQCVGSGEVPQVVF